MGWLEMSGGVFRLHDSDAYCGSLISLEDASEILAVDSTAFDDVRKRYVERCAYINELDLHRAFSKGALPTSPFKPRVGNARTSLDEVILHRLFEISFPDVHVEHQVPFGRKKADLRVTTNGESKIIEFVGPSHFITSYQRAPTSPLERKKQVEDHFGVECVIWPFWIQRCSRNVLALFDESVDGVAAVWSTKALFGDFVYPDSAELILEISGRFHAVRDDGIGYMYTSEETPNRPVHPVALRIAEGTVERSKLVPSGNSHPESFWLPHQLWQYEIEMTDRERVLIVENLRSRISGDSIVIEVRTLSWPHPHEPQSTWEVAAELPVDDSGKQRDKAVADILANPRYFRVCESCKVKKLRGRLNSSHCHRCMETHGGIVF